MHSVFPGKLFTVAAPSGAGKTSLVAALVNTVKNLTLSVSYTTRAPRPGEIDGVNYHFVDEAEFKHRIERDDFLEYATVFQRYYGTSKTWVEQKLATGQNVILEIDWQGVQQIKKLFPECVRIFVLPPSLETLKERLLARQQDSNSVIAERLALATLELSHSNEADFLIINDQFDLALAGLRQIIETGGVTEQYNQKTAKELARRLVEL